MQAVRDLGAFLRRLLWVGVIGGALAALDAFGVYDRFVKGGPLDPALLPEPFAGWAKWVAATVNDNLLVLLLVLGSFIAFRDERRDRRQAELARDDAVRRADRVEGELTTLRGTHDALVAHDVEAIWNRQEPATATKRPEGEPAISGPASIEGAFSSTARSRRPTRPPEAAEPTLWDWDREARRSRRRSKRGRPRQPPSPE
jgi:hypothetical protein